MSMTEIILERDLLKQQLSASKAREEGYRAELAHLRKLHPIEDPQIEADRQAQEQYADWCSVTTEEERRQDFLKNGFC